MRKLGTIIYLKEKKEKLMIISRKININKANEKQQYDYIACHYPQGYDENHLFYFNEDCIDQILFEGYSDEDDEKYQNIYEDILVNTQGYVVNKIK